MTSSAASHVYPQGIKLGVDVGTVRVGVALCDSDGILATPFKTLDRNPTQNSDVRVIAALAAEQALSVRAFGNEGVRVSIGEVEANTRFLKLCAGYTKAPHSS